MVSPLTVLAFQMMRFKNLLIILAVKSIAICGVLRRDNSVVTKHWVELKARV
jgi:hypothetical protein